MLGLSGNPAAPQQTCGGEVARKDFVTSNAPFLNASNYSCGARPGGWRLGEKGSTLDRRAMKHRKLQGGTGLGFPQVTCYKWIQFCGWTLLLFAVPYSHVSESCQKHFLHIPLFHHSEAQATCLNLPVNPLQLPSLI